VVEDGLQIETIWSLLDLSDPFEWDIANLPHLLRRPMYGPDDALDVMADSPVCYEDESEGSADWLIVGEVPGGEVLVVPVTTSAYSGYSKLRPITVFKAPMHLENRYRQEGVAEYE
jgi:hypothetical protein